ncbi:MAG: hypothetical protein KatS3mg097_077 [Candidatus Parcubacteria bacterium]|nr:MAG: hypothetical protein KatS3mg097_077 [Candidatus Parcubacteria bacterium]
MTKKVILFLSGLGILISLYLLYLSQSEGVACGLSGCNLVIKSEYSEFLGINVALLGVIYFVVIFFLFLFTSQKLMRIKIFITTLGFIFALYLIYVQFFILGNFCYYCLIADSLALSIFIIFNWQFSKANKQIHLGDK